MAEQTKYPGSHIDHVEPIDVPHFATCVSEPRFPLKLYATKKIYKFRDGSSEGPMTFAHWDVIRGGVHVLPIVTHPDGERVVHLLITKRPAFGGRLTLETPAGMLGDTHTNEHPLDAAAREAHEETGYTVDKVEMLADQFFATSAGMSTEQKVFALAYVSGMPSDAFWEEGEKETMAGFIEVSLSTFLVTAKFKAWLAEMAEQYTVCADILAVKALLPADC